MKSAQALKRGLERVRRHCDAARFGRAFKEIDKLFKEWPENPDVLVMWANLLQLQDEDVGPPLEEARVALERAVDLDGQGPMPLIELGQYLYALEDDNKGAIKCFTKAVDLCKRLMREALVTKAKALAELGRRSEALACLAEAYWLHSPDGKASGNGRSHEELLEKLQELAGAV